MGGGHGTAAGLRESYTTLGYPEGGDLAVTSATIGIVLGVVVGTILCNLGTVLGWTYGSYAATQKAHSVAVRHSSTCYYRDSMASEGHFDVEDGSGREGHPVTDDADDKTKKIELGVSRGDDDDDDSGVKEQWDEGSPSSEKRGNCLTNFGKNVPKAVIPIKDRPVGAYMTSSNDAIDTLTLHLGVVGLAILLAYLTIRFLMWIETFSAWLTEYAFLSGFPVFPFAMLWGLAIQVIAEKFGKPSPLDRGMMQRIGGAALDFLVLTAIATTKLDAVAENIAPLCVLLLIGFCWVLFTFFVLAPLMLPDFWFERAIAEFGMATGTTAIGLMLLRIIDPDMKTPALKAFSCKQLVTEPFMGGGLVTSLSLPLISAFGNWFMFGLGAGAVAFWMIVWFVLFRPMKKGFPIISWSFNPKQSKLSTELEGW